MICDKCGGVGWIYGTDPDGYTVARRCGCVEAKLSMRRLERLGLKEVAESKTLDAYKIFEPWQRNVLAKAKAYKFDGWVFMGGQTGCGKTHICTALTVNWIKRGHAAEYMLWRQDATRLKKSIVADSEMYNRDMGRYTSTSLLYIDDLFKGKVTEADINLAFELIDARYRAGLLTIISSEKTLDEIVAIDEAIAGRINESASVILNIGKGFRKNWRLQQAKEA